MEVSESKTRGLGAGSVGDGGYGTLPSEGASRSATSAVVGDGKADEEHEERVLLNVGGRRFECFASTLASKAGTLLGAMFDVANRGLRRPDARGEHFFDRDPDAFSAILNFYRTGKLFPPPGVSEELLMEECMYFQIPVVGEGEHSAKIMMCGKGDFGQLGTGDRRSSTKLRRVENLEKHRVVHVSLGTSHSAALTADGAVLCWGYGGDGRLGVGDTATRLTPTAVSTLSHEVVAQVVCGELHTAAITASGAVYTWGLGQDGRLGHGDTASQWLPMRVEALADVIVSQVACGGLHTAVLTVEGECYTFGLGKDGRLGLGGDEHRLLPSLVAELSDYRIVQVACGGHHTAALTDEGKVWMWGFDDDGRLGLGATGHQMLPCRLEALADYRVVQIACGCWHSAALTEDGSMFTWGSNKSGQLGQASKSASHMPRVVLQGKDGGIVAIACGTAHTAALSRNGSVYTWGKQDDGRLGFMDAEDVTYPVRLRDLDVDGSKAVQIACGVYDTAVVVVQEPDFVPLERVSNGTMRAAGKAGTTTTGGAGPPV